MKLNFPILAAFACASLALASCSERSTTQTHASSMHKQAEHVYKFADGRYAYQDEAMIWWYYLPIVTSSSTPSTPATTTTPVTAFPYGSWSKGAAPTKEELDEASEENMDVVVDANGQPVDEMQAEAAEAAIGADAAFAGATPAAAADEEAAPAEDAAASPSEGSAAGSSGGDGGDGGGGGGDGGGGD